MTRLKQFSTALTRCEAHKCVLHGDSSVQKCRGGLVLKLGAVDKGWPWEHTPDMCQPNTCHASPGKSES